MTDMGTLLVELVKVFTSVTTNVEDVLILYTSCTVLILLLALKFSGAIFGFASRLLHRR